MTSKLDLDELRRGIDAVDQQILKLLHERVRLVMAVGEYKRERGIPVYDPAPRTRFARSPVQRRPAPHSTPIRFGASSNGS